MTRNKAITRGLIGLAAMGVMALGHAAPAAAAAAGAQTGWEYAGTQTDCSGIPPNPASGVHLATDLFVLRDVLTSTDMEVTIGDSVAAPQGAAPGTCTTALGEPLAVVPGPITITSVKIGGTTCSLSPSTPSTFTRVNTTVAFVISLSSACGGATTYAIAGNMVICDIPVGPFTSVRSPVCDGTIPTPYADPYAGGPNEASAHLVTTFVSA